MHFNVCVIGLGTVGLPTAKYIREQNIKVHGYDVSSNVIKQNKNQCINMTTNWDEVPQDVNLFVVCVSTEFKNGKPDITSVLNVCEKIAERSPTLVSVESTVPVGSCRQIWSSIFKEKTNLVHVPHRLWEKDLLNHGINQLRVIGAVDSGSMSTGVEFYEKIGIPLHKTPYIEIAEMTKITENSYRFVQIAFAEELNLICRENELDFEKLREACNTKWNIQILEARDGIGGTCLPKDTGYLSHITKYNHILNGAVLADTIYKTSAR